MVKRLHLGRASEAACWRRASRSRLHRPHSVLEGPFVSQRLLRTTTCALIRGLGEEWATLRIMPKRFPVHITSHTSVQAVQDLRREHGYDAADVARSMSPVTRRWRRSTTSGAVDLMMAQYSLPFCVALAHHREPRDPASFSMKSFNDPAIRSLAERE